MSRLSGAFVTHKKFSKTEILLTLLVFCAMLYIVVVVGHGIKEKYFIHIWVPRDQMNRVEATCQDTRKEVRIKYPSGAELVLPCSVIEE